MIGTAMDRRIGWQPPERPEWVSRINEEGACMDISGVVPLDEQSLLDTARRNTGLSDFGGDEWIEPFRIFIHSLNEDAELNLMGRLITRSETLQFLEGRLRIEDIYKRYPEIEDERIIEPLFIIGQERTGTSILHQLLTQVPENGTVKCWEAVFPCPPPEAATYLTDPNAGAEGEADTLDGNSEAAFDRLVNVKGIFLRMKHEILQMRKQKAGAVINLGSVNSFRSLPGTNLYTMTKHAAIGLTRNAADDCAGAGIRINAICPGAIDTPMLRSGFDRISANHDELIPHFSLLNRLGRPEEIAQAALWLCSPGASFTHGHALAVDGGFLAR